VNSYGILDGAWAYLSGLGELGEYEEVLEHREHRMRIAEPRRGLKRKNAHAWAI
jgi:hypothetical protein